MIIEKKIDKYINEAYDTDDVEYIENVIETEGFASAFLEYGSFKNIKDSKFHALRKKFVKAEDDLGSYIDHMSETVHKKKG